VHEASIALSIIEAVEKECTAAGCTRVEAIEVNVGGASGVFPEALSAAFEVVREGTLASEASLVVNYIPLGGSCRGCGQEFDTREQFILQCPLCGGKDFALTRGRELDLVSIEVG
jgi:hydrogenase nickel incorporation protein HypA/HybF